MRLKAILVSFLFLSTVAYSFQDKFENNDNYLGLNESVVNYSLPISNNSHNLSSFSVGFGNSANGASIAYNETEGFFWILIHIGTIIGLFKP